jgi:hypothetical protein
VKPSPRAPWTRALLAGAATAAAALLAACGSSTPGAGSPGAGAGNTTASSAGTSASIAKTTSAAPAGSTSAAPATTTAAAPTTPAAPATILAQTPIRTKTANGYTYVIWAERNGDNCAAKAYGVPLLNYLNRHTCRGVSRQIVTTKVNGRDVVMTISSGGFVETNQSDPYAVSAGFKNLIAQDGTGDFYDLFTEGYRYPNGPTAVPSVTSFIVVGQDSGFWVVEAWYLTGSTDANDAGLKSASTGSFLSTGG